jgi:hypothetical protein
MMSGSDLRSLREYVANVLDYDPNNATYKREIDRLLNEADRSICLSKPFTFINKAADLQVYSDRTASLAFTNNTQVVTAAAPFFEDWMVNQEVEVNNETYRFVYIESGTQARIDRPFESATATYESKVINRYIDLPDDCTTVLNVARRTNTRTPNEPGMLSPLTRYEDEWHNLPLGETNVPIYWLYHDPSFIDGPRRNFDLNAVVTAGAGVRTIEVTSTYIQGGRESAHGEIVSRTYQDNETATLTPYTNNFNDGRRKRYYFRAPTLGYYGWRLLTDQAGLDMDLAPNDTAVRQLVGLTQSNLTSSEGVFKQTRFDYADGFTQRVRLYPRQDQDYVFTVRYMQRHIPMQEDNDVSAIPPDHRMLIAYKALSDIFVKHDNLTQSELYRRRFDEMLLRLERRYLITPARRIVKGNWLTNMEPNSFNRFTTLVHT